MAGDTERIDSLACSPGLVVHKTILGAAASASCTIGDFKRREGPRDRREFLVTLERVRGEGLSIGNDDVRLYCARHKLSEINGAEFLRGAANILLVDAAPSLRLTAAARDALLDGVLWRQEIDPDQVTTLVDSDLGGLMRADFVKRVFGAGLFRAPLLVFSDFLQVSRMIIQVKAARLVARDTVGAPSYHIEDEFRTAMATFRNRQEELLQTMGLFRRVKVADREFSPADPFIKYCAWTPEEERYLTTNWDANDKGRVRLIAAKLNRSRSSVIGKAHRMALRFLIPSRGEGK